MFGVILVSVITLMHLYVFGRTAAIPLVRQYLPVKYLIGIGLLLWALFFLGRMLRHNHHGALSGLLESIGMGWMGALFLIFCCLLLADLVTLFGFLMPRVAPWLRVLALGAGIALSTVALVQGLRPPVVSKYTIALSGLPDAMDGKVIVALSDMHLGSQLNKNWLAARVDQVRALKPDLVVLLGDILDGHDGSLSELVPAFRSMAAPLGVWAVLGNHEFYRGAGNCIRLFETAGVKVLRNSWSQIHPGLILAGVDDLTVMQRRGITGDPVGRALARRPAGATILLSHTPWQAQKAADAGVGLMLSGHTHAGQIWPFGYLVRRVYPLFKGLYQVDAMAAIVSRGTGTWGPRLRLWQPGEILRITLQSAES